MKAFDLGSLNLKIIEHLLAIPFPYMDILRAQIQAAKLDNEIFPDCYRLRFEKKEKAPPLPQYVDAMPLSWQIPTNDVPLVFHLFTEGGYIRELEVVDMGLLKIDWKYIWDEGPILDFCYDEQLVSSFLMSRNFEIQKIICRAQSIDFIFKSSEEYDLASFRGCQVTKIFTDAVPMKAKFKICRPPDATGSFTIISSNGEIQFDCQLMFLRRNVCCCR